jgi:hypothetical protein
VRVIAAFICSSGGISTTFAAVSLVAEWLDGIAFCGNGESSESMFVSSFRLVALDA